MLVTQGFFLVDVFLETWSALQATSYLSRLVNNPDLVGTNTTSPREL